MCGTRNTKWNWVKLQIGQMMNNYEGFGAEKAGGPDGWARSEWKQIKLEMLNVVRDMVKMGEIVERMAPETVDERSRVRMAAVALILKEANQMPVPLDLRPITVTCLLYNLWAGKHFVDVIRWCKAWLPKSVAGGIPENRIQQCVWTVVSTGT